MLGPLPLRAAARPFTRCRYCMPPVHRCPRRRQRWQRQRQRMTEGTAMAPWNGRNDSSSRTIVQLGLLMARLWQQRCRETITQCVGGCTALWAGDRSLQLYRHTCAELCSWVATITPSNHHQTATTISQNTWRPSPDRTPASDRHTDTHAADPFLTYLLRRPGRIPTTLLYREREREREARMVSS